MATVKNFGLAGVGSKIQMGKSGGHLDYGNVTTTGGGQLSAVDEAGTALDFFNVLDPTTDTNAATKLYVDSVATGLDVKNSVRVATTTDLDTATGGDAVYTAGVSEGQGTWTVLTAALTIDGVTLATGDRFLIKDEAGTDREGHGIWVYTSTGGGTAARSTDADNTPANEVSGGMFTFVEEGDVNAEQGFVMTEPNGVAVVDTAGADVLLFTQFSGAASFNAGVGLTQTGNTVDLDIGTLGDSAINILDSIAFEDQSGGIDKKRSWTNILTDLDILTDAVGGNALTADQGITFTGNNLALTIPTLTDGSETLLVGDSLAVFDGTATLEYTFTDVIVDLDILTDTGGANALTASEGIDFTSQNLTLTIPSLTGGAETLLLADTFAVFDGTATLEYTLQNLVDDLDIPNSISGNGLITQTTDGTFTARTIVASAAASEEGIVITNGDGVAGNPTVGLEIDGLTENSIITGSDKLVVFDGTNNRKVSVSELLFDVQGDRIEDPLEPNNFVDTNATTDSVTIGVDNFADDGSLAIAEFKHGAADGDCGFIFTNGADEVRIETTGETNCDIRLVPAGTGSVLIGDAGAATIQGDDDTALTVKGGDAVAGAAGDLILEGGDGSGANDDGDVLIRPGTGGDNLGFVCIQDEQEENVACFLGTTGTDVNYFEFTSAITTADPQLSVVGTDAAIDFDINSKGAGRINLDGNSMPTSQSAVSSVFVIGDGADPAGDVSAVQATLGGATKQFLQFNDTGDVFTWESFDDILADFDVPNGITTNGLVVLTTDDTYASRTIVFSTTASEEGIIINNGDGVAGNPEVGLDIQGLTLNTVISGSDNLVLFDGANNRKVTVDELFADSGNSYGQIAGGDGGTTAVSSSANELITFNGTGINIVTANSTEDADTVTFTLDVDDLGAGAEVLALTDTLAVYDGTTTLKYTFTDVVDDLNIPNGITVNGLVTLTTDNTYVSRSIAASVVAGDEGISVVNGDGVAGNPTVGLDILGLTANTVLAGSDNLVIFDGTNNRKVTVDDFVSSGDQDLFLNVASDSGTAVADNPTDTLTIAGGAGISTAVVGDTLTITNTDGNVDQDLWATITSDSGSTTADTTTDTLTIAGGLGVTTAVAGDTLTITVDNTRITDGVNTFVDTDEVAGKVTINTDDGTGGAGTQLLATFSAATSSSTVTDANFLFTNEDSVDTLGNDEIQICAAGTATDIDVRIKPKGAGEVILGDTAANATLSASDGATGFDLTLEGGDGTAGAGGDVIIIPGDGSAGVDGTVCITDADSVNVMCFEGDSATTAVSYLTTTNAPTGGTQSTSTAPEIKAVSSDSNVDIGLLPKGTGTLSVSGTTNYEVNVTDDDDIPNKKFVDDALTTQITGMSTVLFDTLDDDGLVTGTNEVPEDADITRVVVEVTSVYAGSQGFDIGTVAGPARVTDDSADGFVDWQTTGIYIIENHELFTGVASLFLLTVSAVSSGSGAGTIRVEFANA